MAKKLKIPKINWRIYAIVLATILLIVAVIVPGGVRFNRDVLMLLGVIVVLALWPTLKNAKIPYIMEIKKKSK